MWTSAPVIKDEHALRTTGPYALTRHPIYTGLLGMLAGTACVSGLGRWVGVVAIGVLLVIVKLRAEERLLERTFGETYQHYRRRVPLLVPGRAGVANGMPKADKRAECAWAFSRSSGHAGSELVSIPVRPCTMIGNGLGTDDAAVSR